jgi:hypothetical protein
MRYPLSVKRMASNGSSCERRNVAKHGKRKGKEIEGSSPSQSVLKRGRRL